MAEVQLKNVSKSFADTSAITDMTFALTMVNLLFFSAQPVPEKRQRCV